MFELTPWDWAGVLAASALIGMTKTGIPGMGILGIILLANVVPPRESTGLVLPVLIIGDIFAVTYYRRHAVWKHLLPLLPWAVVGIVPGYFLLKALNNQQFGPVIGTVVLVLLVVRRVQMRFSKEPPAFVQTRLFAGIVGVLAGVVTMLANAAGPIMVVYLLAMRLPKKEFVGTGAWYYLIVNCLKIPFSAQLGFIHPGSLKVNLVMVPMVLLGALVGVLILKRLPQKAFEWMAELLAAAAAVKLLVG